MDIGLYDRLVGRIYDCAVDPDQWKDTLTAIRDAVDASYISMAQMNFQPAYLNAPPGLRTVTTEWDMNWLERLPAYVSSIPHFGMMLDAGLDEPITQLSLIDEREFRKSSFYNEWLAPQGIRDTCIVNVVRRDRSKVVISAPTPDRRALYKRADLQLLGMLSPHLRRALMISDLFEEKNNWTRIYNAILDRFSVPVFLVDSGARLRYHNAAAEDVLVRGDCVRLSGGRLEAIAQNQAKPFAEAMERACLSDGTRLGTIGNGMVLPQEEGSGAVAYVLPLGGSDLRRALGPGLAAVFLTLDGASKPPAVEVLSAFSGMTITESRIALSIAEGTGTQETATANAISIHTLRKHLANIYDKTGVRNQAGLAAMVNSLSSAFDTTS